MTLPPDYFDRLYQHSEDPWSFRTRWYELRKRDITLASLPDEHYGSVFEPGCSIGTLSAGLAGRADRVLGMDPSAAALATARADLPDHVELVRGTVPADWPSERWDLIVLSEVGYYLDRPTLRILAELSVAGAGDLVAVHWRHPVDDYPLTGDEVHEVLSSAASAAGRAVVVSHIEEDFRLDVWSADGRSVAGRSGVPGAATER